MDYIKLRFYQTLIVLYSLMEKLSQVQQKIQLRLFLLKEKENIGSKYFPRSMKI
jgi:hypothetical protein